MLKVAIVGCGKIADSHASQIQRIKGCEIVGVCDREPLMARQLYERFPVKRFFGQFIVALGQNATSHKPYDILTAPDPQKIRVDGVQASLIFRRRIKNLRQGRAAFE